MGGVLRVVAWIWIVITSLGGVGTALLSLDKPAIAILLLVTNALLVLPGLVVLWFTKSKAPQD